MRYLLVFWGAPLGFFWGWYYLSLNDVHMGTNFFSRPLHDLVFNVYGNILGMDPSVIPGHIARACLFDTVLIFGIFAFRKRAAIKSWISSLSPPAHAPEAPREIA